MKKDRIALDVDGVIANFYLAVCRRFNHPYESVEKWYLPWLRPKMFNEEARDKAIAVINGGKDGDVVQQSSELNLDTENKLSEKENYCMANADNSYQIVENPPQA